MNLSAMKSGSEDVIPLGLKNLASGLGSKVPRIVCSAEPVLGCLDIGSRVDRD